MMDYDDPDDLLGKLTMRNLRQQNMTSDPKKPQITSSVHKKKTSSSVVAAKKSNEKGGLVRCHFCGCYVSLVRAKDHIDRCCRENAAAKIHGGKKKRVDQRLPGCWEAAYDEEEEYES